MASNERNIKILIKTETAKSIAEIKKLRAELNKLKGVDKNFKKTTAQVNQMSRSFSSLTKHVSQLAIIYGGFSALQSTVRTFADFESSISKLGVISGATSTQLAELEATSKDLGSTTVFTATQVADGLNAMAMAGLSADESLSAIAGSLSLASIGSIDVAESALLATRAMNGFNLEADDMGRIADVMAKAVTTSATTVSELGDAYRKVASVSAQFGNSLEETTAVLGTLADAGRVGAEAGTQLKIAMLRLTANVEVKKYLQELSEATGGLSTEMYNADGSAKTFIEQLEVLQKATAGLSEEARNTHLARIVGSEAVASFTVAINNIDKIKNKVVELEESFGFASKSAKDMMDNLQGDFAEFNSALEGVVIELGEGLSPILRQLLDEATDFLQSLNPDELQQFGEGVGEITKVMADMVQGIGVLIKTVGDFSKAISNITGISGSAQVELLLLGVALTKLANFAKPLNVALTTLVSGMIPLGKSTSKLTKLASLLLVPLGLLKKAFITLRVVFLANPIGILVTAFIGLAVILKKVRSDTKDWIATLDKFDTLAKATSSTLSVTSESMAELGKSGREAFGAYLLTQIKDTEKAIHTLNKAIKEEESAFFRDEKAILSLTEKMINHKAQLEGLVSQEKELVQVNKRALIASRQKQDSLKKEANLYQDNKEAIAKLIVENKEWITSQEDTNKKRVSSTIDTLNKLYKKEQEYSLKIANLEKNKLKVIQDNKNAVLRIGLDSEDKIANARAKGFNDYQNYLDSQKRAKQAFSAYEKAESVGNFSLAKIYLDKYLSLIEVGAGEEIKVDDKVKVSKARTLSTYVGLVKKGADAQIKEEKRLGAISLQNAIDKIANAKAEQTIIRQNILTQMEYLQNLAKIAEVLTGIKPNLDMTQAKKAVGELEVALENTTSKQRLVELQTNVDSAGTEAQIAQLKLILETPISSEVTYEPETTDVENKTKQLTDEIEKPHNFKVSFDEFKAIQKKVQGLKQDAKEPTEFELQVELSNAGIEISSLQVKASTTTQAEHELLLNNAIAEYNRLAKLLQRDTYSTHYVKTVNIPARQAGGLIPKFADGGYLQNGIGHTDKSGKLGGYGGGDKIKALLEAGEFIVRKEAVRRLGLDRLNTINQGKIPKFQHGGQVGIPKFAVGGSVSTSTTPNRTVNLNLKIGDKTFQTVSDEQVASSLANYLQAREF